MTTIVSLSPVAVQQFTDNNGAPLSGGKLFTYEAGTTTKQNTYTDSTGDTPNTNPIILNSRGECDIWLDITLSYKFVLSPPTDTDPPTNPIWTVDNVFASGSGGGTGGSSFPTTTALLAAFPITTILPDGFISSTAGRTAEGDGGGAEFFYNAADVTSTDNGGTIRVDTAGRRWYWNGSGQINLALFCGSGDGVTDYATNIQNAINSLGVHGGEIYVPPGTFIYGSDIRVLTNNVTMIGAGASSVLSAKNSAKFYLGQAVSPGGFVCYFPILEKLSFAAKANHSGAIVIADQTQNFMCRDCSIGVLDNNGSTSTDGLMLKWTQYTMVENLISFVNRYNIYILLDTSPLQNEDHYSIMSSWLYTSKVPKAGDTPASIAIERVSGRTTAIEQFAVYSTHMGKFTSGGAALTSGVLGINEGGGTDKRELENGNLISCFFENHDYGVNFGTRGTNDTSFLSARTCEFLAIGNWCFYGSNQFKTTFEINSCFMLNSSGAKSGARALWSGKNTLNNVTTAQGDAWRFDKVVSKEAQGAIVGPAGEVRLKGQAVLAATAAAASDVITHGLNDFGTGITPNNFQISTSWNTVWWITAIGATTFTINYATPPGAGQSVYWGAELIQF